jgi:hypothetical protein
VPNTGGLGGRRGIQSIGFAAAAALAAVGPVHLHHLDTSGAQLPADPSTVAAGALHPNPGHGAGAAHPILQPPISSLGGRKRCTPQQAAVAIQQRGNMDVFVGVDPAEHHPVHQ